MIVSHELILYQIDQSPAMFEKWIVLRLLYDKAFAARTHKVLFQNHEDKPARAFTVPQHKVIARAVVAYHQLNGPVPNLALEHLWLCFEQQAAQGFALPDALPDAWNYLQQTIASSGSSWETIKQYTNVGMTHWLREIRGAELVEQSVNEHWTSDKLQKSIQLESSYINGIASQEKVLFGFGDGMDNDTPDVERFRTSLAELNMRLGGGLGRGEACLVVGSSNSGKTVLSTQLLAEQAMLNRKCVYITTERTQDTAALECRIVAAQANVPYIKIDGGIKQHKLSPQEFQRVMELRSKLNMKNLVFIEWWKLSSRDLALSMREELDRAAQVMGGIDMFVLDWIGGAMAEDAAKDAAKIRLCYQSAADAHAAITHDLNCVGIAMAQGNPVQCKNNALVDETCVAECKTMHREFPCGWGISGLVDRANDGADPTKARLLPEQILNVFKTRRGMGGPARVRTRFDYQKYVNR